LHDHYFIKWDNGFILFENHGDVTQFSAAVFCFRCNCTSLNNNADLGILCVIHTTYCKFKEVIATLVIIVFTQQTGTATTL